MARRKRYNLPTCFEQSGHPIELLSELVHTLAYATTRAKYGTRLWRPTIMEANKVIEEEGSSCSPDYKRIDASIQEVVEALETYCLPFFSLVRESNPETGEERVFSKLDEQMLDDETLKVYVLSGIPKDYRGYVLHVNDHGNMTLYTHNRGRLCEVWGIV